MLHDLLVAACRRYQTLFRPAHEEEGNLVNLHTGDQARFLARYFEHEAAKASKVLQRFAVHLGGFEPRRVLDFGCGGGGLTHALGLRFAEVVGIDIHPAKLQYAQRESRERAVRNVRFVAYRGSALPFHAGAFDALFCVDVVEHLPVLDRFFAEFYRVLAPGGLLLITFGPPWLHPHGKHMWTKLPGWWTHLIFPRSVVMEVRGYGPATTWEEIGIHRLTVSRFHRTVAASGFRVRRAWYEIKRALTPLKWIPGLREFFIAEVVAVLERPA